MLNFGLIDKVSKYLHMTKYNLYSQIFPILNT